MILHVGSGDMIVKMFLAIPLFTKDKQPFFKDVCMEFVSKTPGFCTNKGDNSFNLKCKILAMFKVNTTPGCNK
ncbi:MAG: hypothetical protein WC626_07695 [Methanoregula sp.]